MHSHQQNHWNRVLFYWYQSYHWYQWTISLTNRIRFCILEMCAHHNQRLKLTLSVILAQAIRNYEPFFTRNLQSPVRVPLQVNLQASIQNFIHCPYVLHVFFFDNTYFFIFFLECLLLNLHSFSGTFELSHLSGRWFLQQLNNSIQCRLQNMWRVRLTLRLRFET